MALTFMIITQAYRIRLTEKFLHFLLIFNIQVTLRKKYQDSQLFNLHFIVRRPQNVITNQRKASKQLSATRREKKQLSTLHITAPEGQISLFPALNAMLVTWLSLNSCKEHCAYATTRDEIMFSLTCCYTILQLKTPAILKWLFSKFNFNHFFVSHLAQKRESVHKFNFFSAYTLS